MGRAYTDELLPDRHAVLMMMQGFAAAGADPEIRAHVQQTFADMVMEVAALGGAAPGDVWTFFANGMLLNIVAALELQETAVLTHAHPAGECGQQHGTPSRRSRSNAAIPSGHSAAA